MKRDNWELGKMRREAKNGKMMSSNNEKRR